MVPLYGMILAEPAPMKCGFPKRLNGFYSLPSTIRVSRIWMDWIFQHYPGKEADTTSLKYRDCLIQMIKGHSGCWDKRTCQTKPIDAKTEEKVNNPLGGEGKLWEKDEESITNRQNGYSL